jgi:hypothetical protein
MTQEARETAPAGSRAFRTADVIRKHGRRR